MGYVFFNSYKGPKIDLDEELKKKGLTEEEIKHLWENVDKEIERKKKHWFWKHFNK